MGRALICAALLALLATPSAAVGTAQYPNTVSLSVSSSSTGAKTPSSIGVNLGHDVDASTLGARALWPLLLFRCSSSLAPPPERRCYTVKHTLRDGPTRRPRILFLFESFPMVT